MFTIIHGCTENHKYWSSITSVHLMLGASKDFIVSNIDCKPRHKFPSDGPRLTGCKEVLVMLWFVERMVRMWRQYWRWHQWVSVLQDGHPGGQGAAEGRGDDIPQRLGFVQ